ncbi:MAG: hypothetical protein IJM07_02560, partial [Pyramidobacter sp.]|nr:hypothetical protein [Pyramidobacter sp.]
MRIVQTWRSWGACEPAVALIDAGLLCLAVFVSYALRFSIFLDDAAGYGLVPVLLLYTAGVMLSFFLWGIYRVYWLQTSIEEMLLLMKAYFAPCTVLCAAYWLLKPPFIVPRSVLGMLVL